MKQCWIKYPVTVLKNRKSPRKKIYFSSDVVSCYMYTSISSLWITGISVTAKTGISKRRLQIFIFVLFSVGVLPLQTRADGVQAAQPRPPGHCGLWTQVAPRKQVSSSIIHLIRAQKRFLCQNSRILKDTPRYRYRRTRFDWRESCVVWIGLHGYRNSGW